MCGDGTRHGSGRESAAALRADEGLECGPIERLDRQGSACGVSGERTQIAAVTFDGVRGEAALDAEMVEVCGDHDLPEALMVVCHTGLVNSLAADLLRPLRLA